MKNNKIYTFIIGGFSNGITTIVSVSDYLYNGAVNGNFKALYRKLRRKKRWKIVFEFIKFTIFLIFFNFIVSAWLYGCQLNRYHGDIKVVERLVQDLEIEKSNK